MLVPGLRASGGTRAEGILITRLQFDQQRASFEQQIHLLVANLEQAYWRLYNAYFKLYAREQALRAGKAEQSALLKPERNI